MIYLEIANGRIREYNLLKSYLRSINEPYETISRKDIERGKVVITKDDIADGTIPFIYAILKKAGKPIPIIDSYPEILRPFLYRNITRTKLGLIHDGFYGFIKPADDLKKWTGFVMKDPSDLQQINHHSRHTAVYVSDVVHWLTEWRYYIVRGEIIACGHYDGDENVRPDGGVIYTALKLLVNTPSAYCIDWGVLDDGRTALVEYNDGFSLGWYGEDDGMPQYFDLIKTRFHELMA
jgi:hypothetical protein